MLESLGIKKLLGRFNSKYEYSRHHKFAFFHRKAFKNRDRSLEFLTGIVTDLYVDWNRIQGNDAKHKIPQLQNVVLNGDFNQTVKFFVGGRWEGSFYLDLMILIVGRWITTNFMQNNLNTIENLQ